jgi:hypothetical protein
MADQPDPKAIQEILESLNRVSSVMSSTLEKMVDQEQRILSMTEHMVRNFGTASTDVKKMATYFESSKGDVADLVKLVGMTNRGIFDRKSLREVKLYLEDIYRLAAKASKDADYGSTNQKKAVKLMEAVKDMLKEVGKEAEKARWGLDSALKEDKAKVFQKTMGGVALSVEGVTTKVKGLRGVLASIQESFMSYAGTMGVVSRLTAAFRAKETMAEGRRIFERKISTRTNAVSRFLADIPLDEQGRVDQNALGAMDERSKRLLRTRAKRLALMKGGDFRKMVGELGGGRITASSIRAAAGEMAKTGTISGGLTGTAGFIEDVAAGGGSAAAGSVGKVMAGIEGFAAKAAPWAAALALLQQSFDSMVRSNQDIFTKIGQGGGFFAGTQTPATAFQRVRENITPGINVYGQTKELNLQMAEMLTKFGLSVGNLTEAGNDLSRNIIGMAGGKVGGGIAATAFGAARVAGLDPVAATEQILKLLMQYHQSLESTDQFFVRILGDTKAAGITTMKYIQIIDDVTGQFDSMAKGIENVTSTLRVLGHTGALTADQMEDSMKAMFDTKTTTEMGAYLMMNMPQPIREALQATQGQAVTVRATQAHQAMVDALMSSGMERGDAEKELAKQGFTLEQFGNLRSTAPAEAATFISQTLEGKMDPTKRKLASNTLDYLQKGRSALAATQYAIANPGARGALAFSAQAFPGTAMASFLNLQKVIQSLKLIAPQTGETPETMFRNMMLNPAAMAPYNLFLKQLPEALQFTQEDIFKQQAPVLATAGATVNAAIAGKLSPGQYEKIAKYIGLPEEKRGKEDVIAALTDKARGEENKRKAGTELGGDIDTLVSVINSNSDVAKAFAESAEKTGADMAAKGKELGISLTPTEKYLQQILDILSKEFLGLVTTITNDIEILAGPAKKAMAIASTIAAGTPADLSRYGPTEYNEMLGTGGYTALLRRGFKPGGDVSKLLSQTEKLMSDLQDQIGVAQKAVDAAAEGPDKEVATTNLQMLQRRLHGTQQLYGDVVRAGGLINTKGIQDVAEAMDISGRISGLRKQDELLQRQGGMTAVPKGAQPGAAATGTGAEAAKAETEKTPNVSVHNIQTNISQGTVQASTGDPNSILDGKETSVQSATQAGSAILDKAKKSTKKTTTSLADF